MSSTTDGHRLISSRTFELAKATAALWEKERLSRIDVERVLAIVRKDLIKKNTLIEGFRQALSDTKDLREDDQLDYLLWKKGYDDIAKKRKRRSIVTIIGVTLIAIIEAILLILTSLPSR